MRFFAIVALVALATFPTTGLAAPSKGSSRISVLNLELLDGSAKQSPKVVEMNKGVDKMAAQAAATCPINFNSKPHPWKYGFANTTAYTIADTETIRPPAQQIYENLDAVLVSGYLKDPKQPDAKTPCYHLFLSLRMLACNCTKKNAKGVDFIVKNAGGRPLLYHPHGRLVGKFKPAHNWSDVAFLIYLGTHSLSKAKALDIVFLPDDFVDCENADPNPKECTKPVDD